MKEQLLENGKVIGMAMDIGAIAKAVFATVRCVLLRAAPKTEEPDPERRSPEPVVVPRSQPVDIPENFVLIRGGEFSMGSPTYEEGRRFDETLHQVKVSDYYLCRYTVTQTEWESVTGTNPSRFKGDNLPVEQVSWDDCQAFIHALNRKTGNMYRLPTEAEWEYACRAGIMTRFNTSSDLTAKANYDGNDPNDKRSKGVYRETTLPVNSFAPNAWGLYSMHGNVWEWCSDWYDANYYAACKAKGVVTDPENNVRGSSRVLRGGGWFDFEEDCQSAHRGSYTPGSRSCDAGFRLVFVP